jgi:hypothetical protein
MSQYLELLKSPKDNIILPMMDEFMRSLPESLFLGSAIFSFICQSYPIGILVLAMLEFAVLQSLIGSFSYFATGETRGAIPANCIYGLPNQNSLGLLKQIMRDSAFPSGSIFFISSTIFYIMSSIINFSPELKALGTNEPEWNARIPISVTCGLLFLTLYVLWRGYNDCDSFVNIMGSVLFGAAIGYLLSIVHTYLFGRDAINFLGIPLLSDRTATGAPLYVCSTQITDVV